MSSAKRRRVGTCGPTVPTSHPVAAAMSSANRRRVGTCGLTASTGHPEAAASMASANRRRFGTCGLAPSISRPEAGARASKSSAKRRRVGTHHGTKTTGVNSALPHIPDDLLIEIFARSDARTIVRAAATSKPIRRAILSPDFGCRRHAALANGGGGGFDPDLLLGVSCVFDKTYGLDVYFQEQRLPFTFETDRLGWMEPMALRGCLVVHHRRGQFSAELRVINTLTGRVTRVRSPSIAAMYPRTLLAVGDAGRSFELLVASTDLVTRVFSSERGDWGDVVHTRLPRDFISTLPNRLSPALVLGGGTTVHWLCKEQCIVALDVSTASAKVIELPPRCFSNVASCPKHTDKGLLASSPDGRLSLLVARSGTISMWSLSASAPTPPAARWTLQVVIPRHSIAGQRPGCAVLFLRFGERSGAVMLQVGGVGLVQIDLGSRETRVLSDQFKEIGKYPYSKVQLCLHETDVPTLYESVIKNMKHF